MDLQKQIDDLKKQLDEVKQNPFAVSGQIPYNLRQNIQEIVFDSEDTSTGTQQEYELPEGTVLAAKTPTAFILARWKGRIYRLAHYGDL